VVNSGEWQQGLDGAKLTHKAFDGLGTVGSLILSVGLLTFVFSTILGWSYYGEKAVEYLFGLKAVFPYRVAWVGAVMVGSVTRLGAVWAFADIANIMMAVPNLVCLLVLAPVVVDQTRQYLWQGNPDQASDSA
jgi:AGCS family alanine or glycine:cation symporter